MSDEVTPCAISSHIEVIIKAASLLEPELSQVVAAVVSVEYQATWPQVLHHLADHLWVPEHGEGQYTIQNVVFLNIYWRYIRNQRKAAEMYNSSGINFF